MDGRTDTLTDSIVYSLFEYTTKTLVIFNIFQVMSTIILVYMVNLRSIIKQTMMKKKMNHIHMILKL